MASSGQTLKVQQLYLQTWLRGTVYLEIEFAFVTIEAEMSCGIQSIPKPRISFKSEHCSLARALEMAELATDEVAVVTVMV